MDFCQAQQFSAAWQEAMAIMPWMSTVVFYIRSLILSDSERHSDLPP